MTNPVEALNPLTLAQETASWDRQRTNEELNEFVTRRLGRQALLEEVEV